MIPIFVLTQLPQNGTTKAISIYQSNIILALSEAVMNERSVQQPQPDCKLYHSVSQVCKALETDTQIAHIHIVRYSLWIQLHV